MKITGLLKFERDAHAMVDCPLHDYPMQERATLNAIKDGEPKVASFSHETFKKIMKVIADVERERLRMERVLRFKRAKVKTRLKQKTPRILR